MKFTCTNKSCHILTKGHGETGQISEKPEQQHPYYNEVLTIRQLISTILHFIISSRQQWAAFALSFTPSLLPFSLPNCSVCVYPLQYTVWLVVVQGRLLCGWLRKPSGLWTWCRYSCDAAALSPFFLLQTRSRWPMHQTPQQALCLAYPSPTFTLYCRQYVSLSVVSSGLPLSRSVCRVSTLAQWCSSHL